MNDKLNFFIPIDSFEKAKDKDGNEVMKIKGIASTSDLDSDGETLNPNGFKFDKFLKSGFLNFNHMASKDPKAIIGEPTKAYSKNNEMHVEGFLYPSNPIAKSVYNMAKILEKDSTTRRMGYSIEGSVLERDFNNPKIIKSAEITGLAITPSPKCPRTLLEVMKGEVDSYDEFEYDEDLIKAIQADGGESNFEVVKKESLEGTKKKKKIKNLEFNEKNDTPMTKGEIYVDIFGKFTNDIEKAKNIYSLVQKIKSMTEIKEITQETIEKAHNILNMASQASNQESNEEKVEKAENEVNEAKDLFEKAEKAYSKAKDEFMPDSGSTKKAKNEKQDGEDSEDGGEVEEKKLKKETQKSETLNAESIIKGVTDNLSFDFGSKFEAIGNILKKSEEENADLKKSLEGQNEIMKALNERLGLIEQEKPVGRKAVTVSNYVEKGENQENISKGNGTNTYSISKDREALVNKVFDLSNLEKGENINVMFAKAVTNLESSGALCDAHELPSMLSELEKNNVKVVA